MAEILTIKKLLNLNIDIPEYQRPYKWSVKNIGELLSDIEAAMGNQGVYGASYRYRLGTIILHNSGNALNIVDGQQRIISLLLLNICLDEKASFPILNKATFNNPVAQYNIKINCDYIRDYLSSKNQSFKDRMLQCMDNLLEVVVIIVDKETQAFQLFDSQNTRGRALEPHDLLKAYHLREMKEYPYEMRHAVVKWEQVKPDEISKLFSKYMYPIYNWVKCCKTIPFTVDEIDVYKGVCANSSYNYARRAAKASPYFQIDEPFVAGGDFFDMVAHYLELYNDIEHKVSFTDDFKEIKNIIENPEYKSTGFSYAVELFFCVLLCYYDKFRNFDERTVRKLFTWALMIRVDMQNLGFDTINNYAIGSSNEKYSNHIPMFAKIKGARLHTEISNVQINILKSVKNTAWDSLCQNLIKLNNGGVDKDE